MKGAAILLVLSVVCKGDEAHNSCTSMSKWYPGIKPKPVTERTPYKLTVTSSIPGFKEGLYNAGSLHNVTLMSNTVGGNRTFVGFMIYAKVQYPEGVPSFGNFLMPLPGGVEVIECKDGYKFQVAQNYTSEERMSVHLGWKAPPNKPVGQITFSANVAEAPGVYYEGLKVVLKYNCPMPGCNIPGGCPNGLAKNKHDCIICKCAGAGSIGLALSSFLGMMLVFVYHLL